MTYPCPARATGGWGDNYKSKDIMPQLKEILETERNRPTLEQCSVVHLFREGTFYRAYEWSAWLFRGRVGYTPEKKTSVWRK